MNIVVSAVTPIHQSPVVIRAFLKTIRATNQPDAHVMNIDGPDLPITPF